MAQNLAGANIFTVAAIDPEAPDWRRSPTTDELRGSYSNSTAILVAAQPATIRAGGTQGTAHEVVTDQDAASSMASLEVGPEGLAALTLPTTMPPVRILGELVTIEHADTSTPAQVFIALGSLPRGLGRHVLNFGRRTYAGKQLLLPTPEELSTMASVLSDLGQIANGGHRRGSLF